MRPLYRLEFIYLIRELKILEGQILDNVYKYKDLYRLKFRRNSLNVQVPLRLNIAYIHYPNDKQDQVVLRLRKHVGEKLHTIELVDMDRLVKMVFNNMIVYLEFFGKGNIIIDDGERFYTNYPNPAKTKPLSSVEDDIEKYIAMAFGKPYIKDLKSILTGDPAKDLKIIEPMLGAYECGQDFRVIASEGCVPHDSLSRLIDKYYELKIELTSDRYEKLVTSKNRLMVEIEKVERQIEEYQNIGRLIMDNYEKIEEEIQKNKDKEKIYIDL